MLLCELLCASTASVLPSTPTECWGELSDYSGIGWENFWCKIKLSLTGNMGATGVMSCSNPSSLLDLAKKKGMEKAVKHHTCSAWGRDLRVGRIGSLLRSSQEQTLLPWKQ